MFGEAQRFAPVASMKRITPPQSQGVQHNQSSRDEKQFIPKCFDSITPTWVIARRIKNQVPEGTPLSKAETKGIMRIIQRGLSDMASNDDKDSSFTLRNTPISLHTYRVLQDVGAQYPNVTLGELMAVNCQIKYMFDWTLEKDLRALNDSEISDSVSETGETKSESARASELDWTNIAVNFVSENKKISEFCRDVDEIVTESTRFQAGNLIYLGYESIKFNTEEYTPNLHWILKELHDVNPRKPMNELAVVEGELGRFARQFPDQTLTQVFRESPMNVRAIIRQNITKLNTGVDAFREEYCPGLSDTALLSALREVRLENPTQYKVNLDDPIETLFKRTRQLDAVTPTRPDSTFRVLESISQTKEFSGYASLDEYADAGPVVQKLVREVDLNRLQPGVEVIRDRVLQGASLADLETEFSCVPHRVLLKACEPLISQNPSLVSDLKAAVEAKRIVDADILSSFEMLESIQKDAHIVPFAKELDYSGGAQPSKEFDLNLELARCMELINAGRSSEIRTTFTPEFLAENPDTKHALKLVSRYKDGVVGRADGPEQKLLKKLILNNMYLGKQARDWLKNSDLSDDSKVVVLHNVVLANIVSWQHDTGILTNCRQWLAPSDDSSKPHKEVETLSKLFYNGVFLRGVVPEICTQSKSVSNKLQAYANDLLNLHVKRMNSDTSESVSHIPDNQWVGLLIDSLETKVRADVPKMAYVRISHESIVKELGHYSVDRDSDDDDITIRTRGRKMLQSNGKTLHSFSPEDM